MATEKNRGGGMFPFIHIPSGWKTTKKKLTAPFHLIYRPGLFRKYSFLFFNVFITYRITLCTNPGPYGTGNQTSQKKRCLRTLFDVDPSWTFVAVALRGIQTSQYLGGQRYTKPWSYPAVVRITKSLSDAYTTTVTYQAFANDP